MTKKTTKIEIDELSKEFLEKKSKYEMLGTNLVQALQLFLTENSINYLSLNYRIKDKESFLEKVERKEYKNPFKETEDICGIRIICYYQSDVIKIGNLISDELDIVENQDKEDLLNEDQFGYRSTHYVVKIKSNWLQTPNYRGLENLKAEIQVRTILMHAWAEIEHKLSYKSETQIPKQFKRKLFIMSAKLEEADEQFENLRDAVKLYKNEIIEIASSEVNHPIPKSLELNLDSLQAFLDLNFSDRIKDIKATARLVDECLKFNISLYNIIEAYKTVKSYLKEVESEKFFNLEGQNKRWTQTGIIRQILDLTNENYRENRGIPEKSLKFDRKWNKIIFDENKK